jgi:hypothetical protein
VRESKRRNKKILGSLSGAPLWGGLLALPANIRLGWRGLPGTNTLAHYEKNVNYGCKKFYSTSPKQGKKV